MQYNSDTVPECVAGWETMARAMAPVYNASNVRCSRFNCPWNNADDDAAISAPRAPLPFRRSAEDVDQSRAYIGG